MFPDEILLMILGNVLSRKNAGFLRCVCVLWRDEIDKMGYEAASEYSVAVESVARYNWALECNGGFATTWSVMYNEAAKIGQLDVIKEHKDHIDKHAVIATAVKYQHMNIIEWVGQDYARFFPSSSLMKYAAESGNIEILEWLYLKIKKKPRGVMQGAIACKQYAVVEWAHEREFPSALHVHQIWNETYDLKMLKWMYDEREPAFTWWNDFKVCQRAVACGRLDIVEWIYPRLNGVYYELLSGAIGRGQTDVFRYLYNSEIRLADHIVSDIIYENIGDPKCNDILKILFLEYGIYETRFMILALRGNNIEIVEWLYGECGKSVVVDRDRVLIFPAKALSWLRLRKYFEPTKSELCEIIKNVKYRRNENILDVVEYLENDMTPDIINGLFKWIIIPHNGDSTVRVLNNNNETIRIIYNTFKPTWPETTLYTMMFDESRTKFEDRRQIIKFAVSNGCQWENDTLSCVINRKYPKTREKPRHVRLALEQKCPCTKADQIMLKNRCHFLGPTTTIRILYWMIRYGHAVDDLEFYEKAFTARDVDYLIEMNNKLTR
jgi:hypothetical protein